MLSLGKERLSGRIAVEDIPSGHRHLTSVMDAMTEGLELRIEYQKYTSSGSDIYTVRPYAVKEASRRWYLIGYCLERKGLRVYGLDRVKRLDETGNTFRMDRKFSIDELFATSFGIYLPDGPGQTITFRTDETDARYLRDLPVHPSQTEIERREGSVTFSIFVCPNKALIMEFCKYGSSIEVLSPESVREEVASELDKAARLYK
jgi:predicted DNA-binding transcriptional regulator YafY